jgi:hypothetical protein
MALAACGFLTGAMFSGIFSVFFGEDMDRAAPQGHQRLVLKTDHVLLHHVNQLLEAPSMVSPSQVYSVVNCALFLTLS